MKNTTPWAVRALSRLLVMVMALMVPALAWAQDGTARSTANRAYIQASGLTSNLSAKLLTAGTPVTNGLTATYVTDSGGWSITNASSFNTIRWTNFTPALAAGDKITVLYNVTGSGFVGVVGYTNGGVAATAQVGFTRDGADRFTVITTTGAMDRVYVYANGAATAAGVVAVYQGDLSAMISTGGVATTGTVDTAQGKSLLSTAKQSVAGYNASTALAAVSTLETWTAIERQPLFPSNFAMISGRRVTLYPRQMLRGRKMLDRLFVGFENQGTTVTLGPGRDVNMGRTFEFDSTGLQGTSFRIYTRDKTGSANSTVTYKSSTFVTANSSQAAGNQTVTWLGDSTAAGQVERLRRIFNGLGSTYIGKGTYTTGNDSVPYEGRSGSSWLDWLGALRGGDVTTNNFLRTCTNTDKTNHPDLCFADDASYGTGLRPSYAQDSSKASYSIFDWDTWRQNATVTASGDGVALSTSAKHIVVVGLGINDNDATFWGVAARYVADNFKATFPNGAIIFTYITPLSGVASTGTSGDGDAKWASDYEPTIRKMIQTFDNSTDWGNKIAIVPAWCMATADFGWSVTSTSVDSETGVTTGTLNDYIHPQGQPMNQGAEAVLPMLAYFRQTL